MTSRTAFKHSTDGANPFKESQHIARPQSSKILQTFVWWVAQTCLNVFTDVKVVFPVLLTGH